MVGIGKRIFFQYIQGNCFNESDQRRWQDVRQDDQISNNLNATGRSRNSSV